MTRTYRIYNKNKIHKAQRFNLDDDSDIHPVLGSHTSLQVGIPLTRRSWICMGKCRFCRNPNREPSLVRKRNKEQFRQRLKQEFGQHTHRFEKRGLNSVESTAETENEANMRYEYEVIDI